MNEDNLNFFMASLSDFQTKMQEFDKLIDIIGLDYEGTLCQNVFHTYDNLVDALSKLIDDQDDWVSYFIYDCDWGRNPKKISINDNKIEMKTLDDLEKVLRMAYIEKKDPI